MANQWNQPDDDFDDDLDESQDPKKPNPLRDRMRKLEKENKELKEANEKLSSASRKSSVKELLAEAKVKHASKVAGLVPADVEATAEAVKKWLDDFSDVFSIETEEAGEGESSDEQTPEQAEQAEKMARIGKVTAATSTPGKEADLLRELSSKDLKPERLLEIIEKAGGGRGIG